MGEFVRHSIETAPKESRGLLEKIKADYGFIPELFLYMAEAPVVLEAYLKLNELIDKSSLDSDQAQVALLTVSLQNECSFCSVAHEAMCRMVGARQQTVEALKNGGDIEDGRDRALVNLVRDMVEKRGWVPEETLNEFYQAGYGRQQVLELILVVSIKTLSNYSNHLTHPEPNPELLSILEKSAAGTGGKNPG